MRWIPAASQLPHLGLLRVPGRTRVYDLPYLYRPGIGPAILFVHGLGGAKENFLAAVQSPALAEFTLVMFDLPGTGLASFDPDDRLDVSGLADLTQGVANRLLPGAYVVAGTSMGGLIMLLQIRRHGIGRIAGVVNIEGNLASEDCMFSRRAVPHSLDVFAGSVFEEIIHEMRQSPYAGDRIQAHNVALNIDVRAYHTYSFETVAESDSGQLLEEFVGLPVPRLFLYGERNRHLSYLERLRSDVQVVEIGDSGHFLFYDNPGMTFDVIGKFVSAAAGAR